MSGIVYKSYQFTFHKGQLPGDQSYMTEKDWEDHGKYVKALKDSGEFWKPYTLNYNLSVNNHFDNYNSSGLTEWGILVPRGR